MASSPIQEVGDHQVENHKPQGLQMPRGFKLTEDEFWPLSGNLYFHFITCRTHVGPHYLLVLPAKIRRLLPTEAIPTILTYKSKSWEMVYHGEHKQLKNFDTNWKHFVVDNELKVGDGCVFELMENNNKMLQFKVQILRGDTLPEVLASRDGTSAETAIII